MRNFDSQAARLPQACISLMHASRMTQLAMDGSVVPTPPRNHRGPYPVYGPRYQVTARIDEDAADVLRRHARQTGESLSALCARILEREAQAM